MASGSLARAARYPLQYRQAGGGSRGNSRNRCNNLLFPLSAVSFAEPSTLTFFKLGRQLHRVSKLLSIKRREKGQIRAEVVHCHHLVAAQPRTDGTVPPSQGRLVDG